MTAISPVLATLESATVSKAAICRDYFKSFGGRVVDLRARDVTKSGCTSILRMAVGLKTDDNDMVTVRAPERSVHEHN